MFGVGVETRQTHHRKLRGRALSWALSSAIIFFAASANAETARIFIDFGFGWTINDAGLQAGVIGDDTYDGFLLDGITDLRGPNTGPEKFGSTFQRVPNAILPLDYFVRRLDLDYDGDGDSDLDDSLAIANEVVTRVRRIYAPFNVHVVRVDPATLDEIRTILEDSEGKDAYIFAGNVIRELYEDFATPLRNSSGFAPLDCRNEQDRLGFAWSVLSPDAAHIDSMVTTIAHEAGHTFGLAHAEACFLDGQGENCVDVMALGRGTSAVFSRIDLDTQQESNCGRQEQNAFEVLAQNVGLRRYSPAFVSGTGLHDEITISWLDSTQAKVVVRSFENPERTRLHATHSVVVETKYGVLVDAGPGDDHVGAKGAYSKRLTLRGGEGDDRLEGDAQSDTFEGGLGSDLILGDGGHDRIVFSRTAFPNLGGGAPVDLSFPVGGDSLGTDTIFGGKGSDTLDFKGYGEAVYVDLGQTRSQIIDRRTGDVNGRLILGSTSADIEHIKGTPFGDYLVGNALANRLEGSSGNDTLVGRAGSDSLYGGSGYDRCLEGERLSSCEWSSAPPRTNPSVKTSLSTKATRK